MNDAVDGAVRKMPRGVRKGGAKFPRYSLGETLAWSKKLVAKTHSSPQAQDVVYSGVVGSKSGTGDVKISALKQYGLMSGSSAAYSATDLAKKINSAPEAEVQEFLKQAALSPNIFKSIYNTFQSDTVSLAKIRQRAADLGVHPEEIGTCADIYANSLALAGLVLSEGDQVNHLSVGPAQKVDADELDGDEDNSAADDVIIDDEEVDGGDEDFSGASKKSQRTIVNVTINLDSSMDAEKLAKQLKLLRKYGAI